MRIETAAGVQVLEFNPVNPLERPGRWGLLQRNHRKMLAVDSDVAYTGGINITDDELGVALPYRFKGERPTIRVFKDGKSVDCEIVDVGPWNINDPYWETGARPQAESGTDNTGRRTNKAGIDLTPAAADALEPVAFVN